MTGLLLITLALAGAGAKSPLSIEPSSPRLGDLFLVKVPSDEPDRSGVASVFGYEIELVQNDDGLIGVGAVPLDIEPGKYPLKVRVSNGSTLTADLSIADRSFDSSELRVAKRFTRKKHPPALQRRLDREQEAWAKLFEPAPTRPSFGGRMHRPTDSEVTSEFGKKRLLNGEMKSQHYGLDLDGVVGDPIVAAESGTVVMSSMRWGSGGTIVIDHGAGLFSAYFHLSKRLFRKGARVERGKLIGHMGKTGRVTGPHLHFAVIARVRTGKGQGETRGLYADPGQTLGLDFP